MCDSKRYHRNRDTELHPARFPEEMVSDFLGFFTKSGEWVLDPFAGTGATLVACRETGRNGVGIEIAPKYCAIARQRLTDDLNGTHQSVLTGDAAVMGQAAWWSHAPRDLPRGPSGLPEFDFVITSPPYWDMLRRSRGNVFSKHKERASRGLDTHYSNIAADLGNETDYGQYLERAGAVFDLCAHLLREGRYLVIVVQNLRTPDGEVKPLAWDLARRVTRRLSFQGERIWCQDSKPLGIWGYPSVFVPNYHHHYCLIFRKGPASATTVE